MTTSESSEVRFFYQNEWIRITNLIDSNRELECSTQCPARNRNVLLIRSKKQSNKILINVFCQKIKLWKAEYYNS